MFKPDISRTRTPTPALLQEARRLVAAQLQNIVYRVVLKIELFFLQKHIRNLVNLRKRLAKIPRYFVTGSGCPSFWDPRRCLTSPWTCGIPASTCPTYLPTSSTPSPPLHLGQLRVSSSLGIPLRGRQLMFGASNVLSAHGHCMHRRSATKVKDPPTLTLGYPIANLFFSHNPELFPGSGTAWCRPKWR